MFPFKTALSTFSILIFSISVAHAQQPYYSDPYQPYNTQDSAYAMQKHMMKPPHDSHGNPVSTYYGGKGHATPDKLPEYTSYVALQAGYTNPAGDIDVFNSSANYAFAMGKNIHSLVRIEAEISYRNNDAKGVVAEGIEGDADLKNTSFMANIYYDFENNSAIVPYLGVGIGASYGKLKGSVTDGVDTLYVDDDSIALAYQAIAGLSYNLTEQLSLTADYRYLGTEGYKLKVSDDTSTLGNVSIGSFSAHEFRAGLRYKF